jgi:serine/threonine protein kinase
MSAVDQQETRLGQPIGEYRLVHKLGGGGFGVVYLAEHVHKRTRAAIKIISLPLIKPGDFKDFLNEARTVFLRHSHIVPLLDFGISRDDFPFIVMEYAPHGTLRDRHPRGDCVPLSTIVSYVDQIAPALQYAHDQHIIHRDVKPENILVRADGTLLVSDFGIAKLLEQSVFTSVQTSSVGTPVYMAPEQYNGHPCFASDQYALGVVLYEWICGVRPFHGPAIGLALQHMNTPPPRLRDHLPELSEAVECVILKALAKAPEDRFGHMQEMASALREAAHPSPSPTIRSQMTEVPVPYLPPEQSSQTKLNPESETPVVHTLMKTESARTEPAEQPADAVASYQELAAASHSSPHPQVKRNRWPVTFILILLILILIGTGSLGIHTIIAGTRGASPAQRTPLIPGNSRRNTPPTQSTVNTLGRIWHTRTSGTTQNFFDAVWSGSQFVVVGDKGTILISPDGITWTPQRSSTGNPLSGIGWSGSQFVVVGYLGIIISSPDGRTWTPQQSGTPYGLKDITWSGQFVIVGVLGTILTSPDGRTWTPEQSGTVNTLYDIGWSGSQFVAVGDRGTILTSPDGRTWTPEHSGVPYNLRDVVWSGSQFVTVGDKGTILTSPDGHTWTLQQSGTRQGLIGVNWSESQFVTVGDKGTILTSPDGHTWTLQQSGTGNTLADVSWSGSRFVTVGDGGMILTSP